MYNFNIRFCISGRKSWKMSYFCKTENGVNIFLNISKDLPIKPLRPRVSLGRILTTYLINIFVIMDYSVFLLFAFGKLYFSICVFYLNCQIYKQKLFSSLKLFFMSRICSDGPFSFLILALCFLCQSW